MSAKLYIVATPIGNLKDITLRAIEILKTVDLIACEDTRRTAKLTKHYKIDTLLVSYHQHNKIRKTNYLIGQIKAGKNIALVSDSGTPGISDPGYFIVKKCKQENIEIEPIPGVSAVVTALSVSGFPTTDIFFKGFLPVKNQKRKNILKKLSLQKDVTLVFYVSPYNIEKIFKEFFDIFDERKVMIARELTKKFEEKIYTSIKQLPYIFKDKKPKGEFTVIIAPSNF